MQTLNEVIELCEKALWCAYLPQDDTTTTAGLALHYLKEYCELTKELAEQNEPLTWNELKDMIGKPIWVERTEKYCVPHWAIIEDIVEWDSIDNSTLLLQPDDEELFLSDHAKTWQAYRKEVWHAAI